MKTRHSTRIASTLIDRAPLRPRIIETLIRDSHIGVCRAVLATCLLITGCVVTGCIDGDVHEARGVVTCNDEDRTPVYPATVTVLDAPDDGCDLSGCFEPSANTLSYSITDSEGLFSFVAIVPYDVEQPTLLATPDMARFCGDGFNIGMEPLPLDGSFATIVIAPFQN